jgi:hypothetical protein
VSSPSQHVPRVILHDLESAAHALAEAIAVRDRVSLPIAAERAAVALREAATRAVEE